MGDKSRESVKPTTQTESLSLGTARELTLLDLANLRAMSYSGALRITLLREQDLQRLIALHTLLTQANDSLKQYMLALRSDTTPT